MKAKNRIPSTKPEYGRLHLTRRVGESLLIDGELLVTITESKGGSVRLAVIARRDQHTIDRLEVAEEQGRTFEGFITPEPPVARPARDTEPECRACATFTYCGRHPG